MISIARPTVTLSAARRILKEVRVNKNNKSRKSRESRKKGQKGKRTVAQNATPVYQTEEPKHNKKVKGPKIDKTPPVAKADTPNTTPVCCKAMTASCLSCASGKTIDRYCSDEPDTIGCPCTKILCMNGSDLTGTDSRGCGGTCENTQ